MYDVITDELYLPAFLEYQIRFLCTGDVKWIKHVSS